MNGMARLYCGDALDILRRLPDASVRSCVTSPPYWGLRDYGTVPVLWGGDPVCDHEFAAMTKKRGSTYALGGKVKWGHPEVSAGALCRFCGGWLGSLGLEPTPEMYVAHCVLLFREVRRVLAKDGTLWLNIGDSYVGGGRGGNPEDSAFDKQARNKGSLSVGPCAAVAGLKQKDLVMVPARLALALQADGWWLRSDIIWCLSGGTWIYAKTQSGVTLTTVKDLARLAPESVQLWNGSRWTRLLGVSQSPRSGDEVEIVLRSGERIACTPTHRFPTLRGLLAASELRPGDVLARVALPEPENPRDCTLDEDAAWLAGLYLAEGSRAGDTIQIAGHAKEEARWDRLQRIAQKYAGSATRTISGNCMNIRLYGRVLVAIIEGLVSGHTAHDKGFASTVWRYSNRFLAAFVLGYLEGDGHWDQKNRRWRLGFCRNYSLERDLRAACARLSYTLTLKMSSVSYRGQRVPTFRGEVRTERSGHHNERDRGEVVAIQSARCRNIYDLGVADEPHTFTLASGILSHNSKPNAMPESVRDRPTTSHEYVFLLSRSKKYYYDAAAIAEDLQSGPSDLKKMQEGLDRFPGEKHEAADPMNKASSSSEIGRKRAVGGRARSGNIKRDLPGDRDARGIPNDHRGRSIPWENGGLGRNSRTVWTIPVQAYRGAHFAAFPEELARRCILAGSSQAGHCPECGKVWRRVLETTYENDTTTSGRPATGNDRKREGAGDAGRRMASGVRTRRRDRTLGWEASCDHDCDPVPDIVLDPFGGSGTVAQVATGNGRSAIYIDLNPKYVELAEQRIGPMLCQRVSP